MTMASYIYNNVPDRTLMPTERGHISTYSCSIKLTLRFHSVGGGVVLTLFLSEQNANI